jgi:Lysyl oxidase
MRKRPLLFLVLATLVVSAAGTAATAAPAGTPHLPDLRTLPPANAQIIVDSGRKLLRFSNSIWNAGNGPLHVRPVNDPVTNTTDAFQDVYTHDSRGVWSVLSTRQVGTFVFHEAHNHWHMEDFALYELHRVASGGSIGSLLISSSKISFCLLDDRRKVTLYHSPNQAVYTYCTQDSPQGISVGYVDQYSRRLEGQSIDITSVPDGTYWLVSRADPDNRLSETNDANNMGATKLAIEGTTVKILASVTGRP